MTAASVFLAALWVLVAFGLWIFLTMVVVPGIGARCRARCMGCSRKNIRYRADGVTRQSAYCDECMGVP